MENRIHLRVIVAIAALAFTAAASVASPFTSAFVSICLVACFPLRHKR
jgi:hypothetical protein